MASRAEAARIRSWYAPSGNPVPRSKVAVNVVLSYVMTGAGLIAKLVLMSVRRIALARYPVGLLRLELNGREIVKAEES